MIKQSVYTPDTPARALRDAFKRFPLEKWPALYSESPRHFSMDTEPEKGGCSYKEVRYIGNDWLILWDEARDYSNPSWRWYRVTRDNTSGEIESYEPVPADTNVDDLWPLLDHVGRVEELDS